MDPSFKLLAAVACMVESTAGLARVSQSAVLIADWGVALAEAERQRMSPLFYNALKKAGVKVDDDVLRQLKALTLRHRLVNQVRGRVLAEIFEGAHAAGLSLLVVKGAALCWLIYAEPALRPMVDIDLLTSAAQQLRMQHLLVKLGFTEGQPAHISKNHRHLPPLSKEVEGFHLSVEVHHSLYTPTHGHGHWGTISDLLSPPLEFTINPGGLAVSTLGLEDTLLQLCLHFNEMGGEFGSFRMLWVADIHAFLAKYEDQLNWDVLKKRFPQVINTLAQLHYLAPFSESLSMRLSLSKEDVPEGIGETYHGWPLLPLSQIRIIGLNTFLWRTFFPSPWWLGLYYGRPGNGGVWLARFKHAGHILAFAWEHVTERFHHK